MRGSDIGRPPLSFTIVFVLAFINFCLSWLAVAFHQLLARETSGGEFTYPILFKGGHTWYFTPTVGRFIDWSFVGNFVALALLGLIYYRYRHAPVQPQAGGQPHMPQPASGSEDRRESQ